jgi:hypothetical protein
MNEVPNMLNIMHCMKLMDVTKLLFNQGMFNKFTIMFASSFIVGKARMWGTFPKWL